MTSLLIPAQPAGPPAKLKGGFGLMVLKSPPGRWFVAKIGDIADGILGFVVQGAIRLAPEAPAAAPLCLD